eukprot:1155616-Pelagomonas_calceolata.AAC.15
MKWKLLVPMMASCFIEWVPATPQTEADQETSTCPQAGMFSLTNSNLKCILLHLKSQIAELNIPDLKGAKTAAQHSRSCPCPPF